MAKKISKAQIAKDREVIKVVARLPDYQPVNPACSVEALLQLDATLQAAESHTQQLIDKRDQVDQEIAQGRDVQDGTAALLHDTVTSTKTQLAAQYGPDSYIIEQIGWVRKSERKHPVRKKAGA